MTNNANPPTGNNSARKPRWLRPNIEDPVALRRRERVEVGYRRFRRTAIALFIAGVVAGLIAMLAAIKIWLDQQPDAQGDWVVVQLFGAAALALLLVASVVSVWGVAEYGKAAGQPSPRQR
ncbi:hypothetical protein GS504_02390 [Rhodococcus hoagii]|nr:hypothetical protein [Prescottella equi]NKS56437.1 hypothetical protein [Prescottella equi]NKS64826.1 hypothetical protein [Prescottella equi]NKS71952.1 hypothetical protein [Prescottella equi]NKZ93462.1 hypothetical protein [Prescottella equi]